MRIDQILTAPESMRKESVPHERWRNSPHRLVV